MTKLENSLILLMAKNQLCLPYQYSQCYSCCAIERYQMVKLSIRYYVWLNILNLSLYSIVMWAPIWLLKLKNIYEWAVRKKTCCLLNPI